MKYMIETKNITKTYGNKTVVNNVSINVPKGKIYGLLGRNGAGKTTLMKMILKLIHKTSGEIKLSTSYDKIGSLIESPGFYENLTAYENLKILGTLRGNLENSDIVSALTLVNLHNEKQKSFLAFR